MKKSSSMVFVLVVGLCFILCKPVISRAQVTGTITGVVVDSSGAVVPNATVRITNMGTGVTRTLETNSSGIYTAEALLAGTYELAVEATGFQKVVQSNVALSVADRLGINFTLQVGQLTQTIEVTGAATLVETQTGEQSALIGSRQISEMPILGRNFMQLQALVPGASKTAGDEIGTGFYSVRGFAVNGFNQQYSSTLLDGVYNTDMGSNSNNLVSAGPDTLAEFKVLTSNYSAKYGQGAGAILLAVTKTGTKEFHGGAYEYLRNDKLDATDFFLNRSNLQKAPLRYNDFGYDLGGPFYIPGHYNTDKSKTFFFWSNEWRKENNPSPVLAATPTQAMRSGDFTGLGPLQNPVNPATGTPMVDDTGAPCVGGTGMTQINPNCLNANVGLLLQQDFPMPNESGFLNFAQAAKSSQNWSQELIRVDQNITPKVRAFVRFVHDAWLESDPTVAWSGDSFPTLHSTFNIPSRNLIVKLSTVITPNLLNEFSFNYASNYGSHTPPAMEIIGPATKPSGYTAQNVFGQNTYNFVPDMSFSGGYGGISTLWGPWWAHHNMNEWVDDLTLQAGRHSLAMGGVFMFSITPVQTQSSPSSQGAYSFDGHFTGNSIADALLGLPVSYGELQGRREPSYNFHQFEGYFQDDFKATKHLTLNLGVRYFYIPHVYSDVVSTFFPSAFDPAQVPTVNLDGTLAPGTGNLLNGIVFPSKNGIPRGLVHNHNDTIGPRFGFAFDPKGDGKMAIRGGYGVGYYRIEGNDIYGLVGNPPYSKLATFFNPPFDNPAAGSAAPLTPLALNGFDQVYEIPMTQSWSFGVQRQLTSELMMNVAYVGSRGTHLDNHEDINQPLPALGYQFDPRIACTEATPYPCTTRVPTDYVRPYQGWSSISLWAPVGTSIYHSLQVTVQKRLSHGLSFGAAYTWSKSIGVQGTPQNFYNANADRGPVGFDRTHILVLNYVYDLPVFSHSKGLTHSVLGGWEASGLVTFESGFPLTPGFTSGTQGLASRPDAVAGVSVKGPKTVDEWFNTQAFTAPPFGYFGNAGIGTIRGPGENNWDMSLFKHFRITERLNTQLRADLFNTWNHTNFDSNSVSTTYGSGSFGQITGAHTPRVIQVSLKVEF